MAKINNKSDNIRFIAEKGNTEAKEGISVLERQGAGKWKVQV
jgi:hypothetical protein